MKFKFLLLTLLTSIFIHGCTNEDWNRIDEHIGNIKLDIISKPDPYKGYDDKNKTDDED